MINSILIVLYVCVLISYTVYSALDDVHPPICFDFTHYR